MNQYSALNKEVQLLKTHFQGREDVFAIHWQKGNKSRYMPAYLFDPYRYRLHKLKGGSLKT